MRPFIPRLSRLIVVCLNGVLVAGLGFCLVSSASADDIAVSEQTFGCILDWPKIRNTRFQHADPVKLKEAMRIFRDSVPDKEYPVGTILQLVPFEAMVKHPREKFPKTNGWECRGGRHQDQRSGRQRRQSLARGGVPNWRASESRPSLRQEVGDGC